MNQCIVSPKLLLVTFLTVAVFAPTSVFGHFIWLAKSVDTGKVQVFFGEGPHPDNAQFLGGIESMKIWSLDEKFDPTEIKFEKKTNDDKGWFDCISDTELKSVDCDCSYGVFSRGEKSMLLHYTAKYLHVTNGIKTEASGKLPLDIVVDSHSGNLKAQVLFGGKPASDCEVSVLDEKGTEQKLTTNSDGIIQPENIKPGRILFRAKMVEDKGGEVDGKTYSEKVFYCTLTLDNQVASTNTSAKISDRVIADVPLGITSFGGARINNHVYLYGGHCGDAHSYYSEAQNKQLIGLDLDNPKKWETIGEGIGLQGLAMVAHGGKLYRLGGFNARNEEGEKQDLHSVTDFAVFDFEAKEWKLLDPMPVAQSSFDAVVVGDTIYVVGGWVMKGESDTTWCDSAVSINLAEENPKWVTMETPPFQRRAISLGFQDNQLYVIGGMQQKGGPTRKVAIYDIALKEWKEGPELPGDEAMEGFGSSCFNVGGKLVVSTYGGNIYTLDDAKNWSLIHKCDEGRFFHRLLPISDNEFALFGGANMESGKSYNVEVVRMED